ncbi:MAG: cupin domain-containing protein [Chloroflexota bacterium]
MTVKNINAVEASTVKAGVDTTIQVLISSQEGPNFAMRRFSIAPGGGMPNHTNLVEHEQYVLQGQARISIDGEEYDVKTGDAVFIPAGVPHWYENSGEEPFSFLCIVPNRPDEIKILDKQC